METAHKTLLVSGLLISLILFSGCQEIEQSIWGRSINEIQSEDYPRTPPSDEEMEKAKKQIEEEQKAEEKAKTESKEGQIMMMVDDSTEPAAPQGQELEIFRVGNDAKVSNGGSPAHFTTDKDIWVTELWTYHWNDGRGDAPGTIALQSAEGKSYGPWTASLTNKVYWTAKPLIWLPAGSYTVIDSSPSTWAQNGGSGGQGMSWMKGIPKE